MIFNQTRLLNNKPDFKNSEKCGRIPLARYSVNTSKKEKTIILEQHYTSKRVKIVRCYDRVILKYIHIDDLYQSFKISNKKQSP